jgi:subtilisin
MEAYRRAVPTGTGAVDVHVSNETGRSAALARPYGSKLKLNRPSRGKLRQQLVLPSNLAQLAGGAEELPTVREGRIILPRLLPHLERFGPADDRDLRFLERRDPLVRYALRNRFPVPLNISPAPSDGAAYPQWIVLDGSEAGVEMTVPLEQATKRVTVTVRSHGAPVESVEVRARVSEKGYVRSITDAAGRCTLGIPKRAAAYVALSVRPRHSYWGVVDGLQMAGLPTDIDMEFEIDSLQPNLHTYMAWQPEGPGEGNGEGVKVAVVDSGWSGHDCLPNYAKGSCVVGGDPNPHDVTDTLGHGTMVAGVIGARGDGIVSVRGVAPGAEMVAYRALPQGSVRTDGAAIGEGIRRAVDDQCDIVNISIGGLEEMPTAADDIDYAWDHGVVCIVAAGNLYRQPVLYPARYPKAIAVSAMGTKGTYPELSLYSLCETGDLGIRDRDFLPDFTNIGPELALCAPGVGIVSTYLDNTLHSSRGTSFAAPVVAGLLARLLSLPVGEHIRTMARTAERSVAMRRLLEQGATQFGFAVADCEGRGMPR